VSTFEYGKRLTAAREKRGVSLEEVAFELKINLSTLKKIEASNSKGLPKPAFTKGFIKAYCKFLKISPDLILNEYKQTLDESDSVVTNGVLIETSEPQNFFVLDFLKEKFLPLILFVSVISAVFILYSFLGNYEDSHIAGKDQLAPDKMIEVTPVSSELEGQETVNNEDISFDVFDNEKVSKKNKLKSELKAVGSVDNNNTLAEPKQVLPPPPSGKHKLTVEPLAKTYLYIKTNNDNRPVRARLVPDTVRTFRFDQAEIRFMDAGAVNVFLDGDELGALGVFGEEKKLEFPSLKEL